MEAGARLGPYEILEPLGAGGMGEVWLAEDTRLHRKVAIKVLPEEYAGDPERLARFEQEARAAAALNHPHIAVVHDIGTEGDTHFMVQEHLEGQSLRERLDMGALPLGKALDLAIEVAEALIAAHKAGIIHRDLKPDNIFVTQQGHAKVLDFGLAKLMEVTAPSRTSASMSPTVLGTVAGQIMGTAGYMAPEQVNGDEIDHRADLFAFGCVLYEMVAGKQPFAGRNVHDTLGRIVDQDPDSLTSIDARMPVEAQRIVKKCLAKDRARRYQAADDLVVDLQTLSAEFQAGQAISLGDVGQVAGVGGASGGAAESAPGAQAPTSGRSIPLSWAAAIVVLSSFLVGSGVRGFLPSTSPAGHSITAFDIPTPDGVPFSFVGRHAVAISRDGKEIVFTADAQLQRRRMNDPDIVPIAGTESGGRSPFFSPDGTHVGFWYPTQEGGELRKVSISGGLATVLCKANNPFGATWLDDGTILYGQGALGIMRVSSDGGDPEVVIPVREHEAAHGPQLLPDGDSVLFTLRTGSGPWDASQTVIASLAEPEDRQVLFTGGKDARYLSTGHIAYLSAGTLMVRPFDLSRHEVGAAVHLVDGIHSSRLNLTGAAHFATSDLGTLVYLPDTAAGNPTRLPVIWVTPASDTTVVPGGNLDNPLAPRLSPDETHVAVTVTGTDGIPQVEVQELSRGIWTRLTTEGDGQSPTWSHDGTSIYFTSTRGTEPAIYRRPIDLSAPAEEIWRHGGQVMTLMDSASRDGKFLFVTITGDSLPNGWLVRLGDPVKAEPLFGGSGFHAHAQIHPSGRWIAYAREVQSQRDILVSEFPAGRTVQISNSGDSEEHMWSRDGKQLFYRSGGRMMVVDVQTEPELQAGPPRELIDQFDAPDATLWVATSKYDVSSDGRFLTTPASRPDDEATAPPSLRVILNWFEELKERVPRGR